MKVLHLSDSPLSGSPIRISKLLNKYSEVESRHIVWTPKMGYREYDVDLIGQKLGREELLEWLDWADCLHFHNRWKRQEIFKFLGILPPKKPSVIQIHSPRESENFREEVDSGIPIAVIAQIHPRFWAKEMTFLTPNIVDIEDPVYKRDMPPMRTKPVFSYAPSNTNGKGLDDKSYSDVGGILKRMKLAGDIYYQLITSKPHGKVMELKRGADIGLDEVATGSYHLSSLEYLSLGVPCFANVDKLTGEAVMKVTGCTTLPWIKANKDNFESILRRIIKEKSWQELGQRSREWMEIYWKPQLLVQHYQEMYQSL